MSLKWKTAVLFFITGLVIIPISVEYLLRAHLSKILVEQISNEFFILSDGNWFVILIVIFLISLMGYIVGNQLGKKVDELIVGVSKAGGGNYSQRISPTGHDEIAQLIISYNRMLDNLTLGSQESKEQLHNYKSIVDNAAEGIISTNERRIVQSYNKSAEAIFGYPSEEILGKEITQLIPTSITQKNGITLKQSFVVDDIENKHSRELIAIRKNEQNFPIELSISAATINNTQVFTGIIRDITDRKETELRQNSLEMQLRNLQRQNSLESLSGGIAHDFNNILGPILGYADMAMAEVEQDSKLHKYLTHILKSAYRARELVARIMTFNRQTEHNKERLKLNDVIDDSLILLKASLPSKHQLNYFSDTTNDLVDGDRTQLVQVIVSIVNNASQAMSNEAGILTIRVDDIQVDEELIAQGTLLHKGAYVRLRIKDNGVGMDSTTKERVFDPFFSTREQKEGSGLGLSIAYGIISSSGGDILVDSELGKGTTFSVLLPIASDSAKITNKLTQPKIISQKGELILYVDDDELIAELGKEMLENLGYEVAVSVSSEEALQMFNDDPEDFDLVITDQSMPVLTGTQLARELKRIRADIPIILVSGFSAAMINREIVESGIEYCIAKPLVIDELGRIVIKALTESNSL